MFWNRERKSLPQIYVDAQSNCYLQEEDNDAVIAGYSSPLTCKKHCMFVLEIKEQNLIFNEFFIIAVSHIIKNNLHFD